MEHRLYNTGDQIWVVNGQTVKLITHDGRVWHKGQEGSARANSLYHVSEDGGQTWFGQRNNYFHIIKILSHTGRTWSEDDPFVQELSGVEKAIHRVQVFCTKWILKTLT